MLLYTIESYDTIFGTGLSNEKQQVLSGTTSVHDGMVEWVKEGKEYKVSRFISTDPFAYLRQAYTPGAPWRP
ncbi:MAG TPA: hypothetical protein DEP42_05325 [Ruminococcaceae bacterium]|nr:hypothetical protein [Oscillospiraceae bacterium]